MGNEIVLRCGCKVSEDGKYEVAERCRNCKECNAISKLHPFGNERIIEIHTFS